MEKKFEIVFEDNQLIVIDKNHGIPVIEERNFNGQDCLRKILDQDFGKIYIVHRLDAGTGGLLVLAKTAEAHRSLCLQFERNQVRKRYLALAAGIIARPFTLILPVSLRNNQGRYKVNFKSGKPAVTSFYPLSHSGVCTLLEVELHTGRTHQIRVHLRAVGHPLCQDFLYHEKIEDKRLTLFSRYLSFTHPATGKFLEFKIKPGDFFIEYCEKMGIPNPF
ncbi:MAG: RluA family pseudouridine synthase [Candidatus Wallbacteria bacterium]|nr:RluA family pseudouridine synthase [Candidatus Wallbacteria bacterium]